ncbi:MAG: hypothetical protein CMH98_03675 [Oceanospirillaceae bacterium]|nr:hypothetical protein [Oceanospirillaceae bacterium]
MTARDIKNLTLSAARKRMKKPKGKLEPVPLEEMNSPEWMTRAYMNNRVTVMINDNAPMHIESNGRMDFGVSAIQVMVRQHDCKPLANHWRVMQDIKNEIFGPESVAIEYFPAESQLIDQKNIYWMFILPDGILPLIPKKQRQSQ